MRRFGVAATTLLVSAAVVLPAGSTLAASTTASPGMLAGCTPTANPDWSAARVWDEAILDAIRRDLPMPGVHARNLFHLSAGMWDAWAAYDPTADGFFVDEDHTAADVPAARAEAISFAAYRLLSERYANATNGDKSLAEFDGTFKSQCYDAAYTDATGSDPAALGNRIAARIIEIGLTDGSNETNGYKPMDYTPVNPPLIVKKPGTTMKDPNRWQPLALDFQVAQNGVPLPDKVQTFVGPFWGHVTSFGLPMSTEGVPLDPGPPPKLGTKSDGAYKQAAIDVIRASAQLDPTDGRTIDISPGSIGNNDLGKNNGKGYAVNPATGRPYAADVVPMGDYTRALAEFWADGPNSETPPGHWNVIANHVGDYPGFEHRIGGQGPLVDRLEWDVKTYFALNGAVHDAAVAAWGAKGFYDSARPISMIRYLGEHGQSTNKALPHYSPKGLPLVPGLTAVITKANSAPGQPLAALRKHIGQIAIKAWGGNPSDPATQIGGVEWQLASRWVPYQKPTFVTPAFAGYFSGHSTFSRAAAEVLTAMTGSAYFPGGMGEFTVPAGSLTFEQGPSVDVPLQWATYYDAADQAGRSRIYGGIHIPIDDFAGRVIGSQCGTIAWSLAQTYFDGTAKV
ncbi:MAG: vanadium-dependent haloperoxidase [Chloroflexota bacterium]